MAGFLTTPFADRMLDHHFGGQRLEPASILFYGLSLCRAYRSGRILEPSAECYFRVSVPNDPQHFPPGFNGHKSLNRPIAWAKPAEDWGEVLSVFVADGLGRVMAACDLPRPAAIRAGDPAPRLKAGAWYLQLM